MRTSTSPYQPRVLYLMANFVNDAARANKWHTPVMDNELADFDSAGRSPETLLSNLDEAILSLEIARSTAIANAYLKSGADRGPYQSAVAVTACKVPRRSAQPKDHAFLVRGI